MSNDPILHLLGLAKKAGRLEIGEEPVGAACRARQAKLLLLAADAAPNTRRRASHFGETGNVLWLDAPFDKAQLGFILGRSSCAMLALTDAGFSAAVVEKLAARDPINTAPPPSSCAPAPIGCFSGRESSGSTRRTCGRGRKSPGPRRPRRERKLLSRETSPDRPGRGGRLRPAAALRTAREPGAERPPKAARAAGVLPASSVNPEKRGASVYDDEISRP